MNYGKLPTNLGVFSVDCKEMMFYQYLPIKMIGQVRIEREERLKCFDELIGVICCDFVGTFGLDNFVDSYVYMSAKYLYQPKGVPYNRPGWHCDGFMSDDINYIWSNKDPTVFNASEFRLTMDDQLSIQEMTEQALSKNNFTYLENSLIRLDQYNVHKVAEVKEAGMRTFLKLSFSKDKYDLIGNAHNYLFDYNWELKERTEQRNIPQSSL